MLALLSTGLRFGELAGLCRLGSGFKSRPKSDAGIRPVPLAAVVVDAIRRQLPPDATPEDLVFTGAGGGPGRAGGPNVPRHRGGGPSGASCAGLAAVDHQGGMAGPWSAVPIARDPLLDAIDLHGAHDFRHTFTTWLEDAGIPARVIDELMGHQASGAEAALDQQPDGAQSGCGRCELPGGAEGI